MMNESSVEQKLLERLAKTTRFAYLVYVPQMHHLASGLLYRDAQGRIKKMESANR
jgi:hypothetical protein